LSIVKKGRRRDRLTPRIRRERVYERPIPERNAILQHLAASKGPRSVVQIGRGLHLDEQDLPALEKRLAAMERDGQVLCDRRGAYGALKKMDLICGRVIGHSDGFGFLAPDDGRPDIFLSARQMRAVLHGDRAVVHITGTDTRGRPEGAVVEVLERANAKIVGRFFAEGQVGFVVPENKRIHQDILIPPDARGTARHGQIVVATIEVQPDQHRQPIGRVSEVVGEHMAPGMEVDIAIRAHDLPHTWPAEVEAEVKHLGKQVAEADKKGREDLRGLPLVTIDGEDARDFDDAVYCEREKNGFRLIVAIADVSHYVLPNTALDREAHNRGTSVYFSDRVIPMLPEVLSNGLCSLKPKEDRLCLCCELMLNAKGEAKSHRFFEGVMHSQARLTYTEVAAMLIDGDPKLRRRYRDILPHLEDLFAVYQTLRARRERVGAMDFETIETRVIYGEGGRIERIVPSVRNEAHRIIEECMLAANVAAAEYLLKRKYATLYRIHEQPDTEKLETVRTFLGELGLSLRGGDAPHAKDFAQVLKAVEGREDAHLIRTVLLRSMKLAQYSAQNIGHFGLAFGAYTHFTSPIRRYPDLLVHRAIRHSLRKGNKRAYPYGLEQMQEWGAHCSMTERRADEATRGALAWLKCEYMSDKVGEVFHGVISGVSSFGMFVELAEVYVDGLVHITSLPSDYYHFDPAHHRLRGERSGRIFRLANPVEVKVMRVDLDEKRIDLELVEVQPETPKPAKKRRPKKS
jgi:ribonuclease R